jgi:circadian clock protein KaiC
MISSGVPELDELLNGGIDRGGVTLITGSSGVGKTTLGLQFMKEAAGRGERSVVYAFEEEAETLVHRCKSVNIPVEAMADRGNLRIEVIRPGELTMDEFTHRVGREVAEEGARIVMIDGVAGLNHSLVGEKLDQNLHTLGKHLVNHDASLLITDEVREITGDFQPTSEAISYIADNLTFLRYLEMRGELRKAIGVLKKRTSDFEKTLREFAITRYGIKVGAPLTGLRGILRGQPEWSESAATSSSNGRVDRLDA